MASTTKEVATEILPFIRVYKDGSVDRLVESPIVPPSPHDPETGVSSKDISISLNPPISARLFLPPNHPHHKLPILVYFHGGGFCFESAFSADHYRFLNSLVSQTKVLAVSVEYRLAPENPLPIAYEDCWFALQWFASHHDHDQADHDDNDQNMIREPWLTDDGDFERVFLGGDSAGANIVHNIAMRAGKEPLKSGVTISKAFLTHPYFWGSDDQQSSSDHRPNCADNDHDHDQDHHRRLGKSIPHLMWEFVYPSAPGGVDNQMINPVGPEAPSLAGLGCRRMLVSVAEKDVLRERGRSYYEAVRRSGWSGEVQLVDVEGEDHAFQILCAESENAKMLIRRLADFLMINS